ncbi:MAG: UvrD-helicase domain-containing protein, partial [Bacillota bacterium]
MAVYWTPEQLDAITEKGCNLLVAAAAGAGKTAVLVERIIRKITDEEKPVGIDRLLVVTFTNAAATEMRERIGSALADALEADPSSQNLQRQMAMLDRASIMTLHSFCMEVVRSHFHSLELDPMFRVADETESALMKLDALEELFEGKYESEDKDSMFFKLVDSFGGGRGDDGLKDIILTLHGFTRSHPQPEQWLAAQAEAYNIGASACLSST